MKIPELTPETLTILQQKSREEEAKRQAENVTRAFKRKFIKPEVGCTTCVGKIFPRMPSGGTLNKFSFTEAPHCANMNTEDFEEAVKRFITDNKVEVLVSTKETYVIDERIPDNWKYGRFTHRDFHYASAEGLLDIQACLGGVSQEYIDGKITAYEECERLGLDYDFYMKKTGVNYE